MAIVKSVKNPTMLPNFLIVGAQKAGTTAAARNLALHPSVSIYTGTTEYGQKELEFFNQHWERGISWYSRHFESSAALHGEKTAELLHRTICHRRMHETNPRFKLIVLLRSPIERAYSQWKMATFTKGDESDTFDVAIRRELESLSDAKSREMFYNCCPSGKSNWREGYLMKGMYAEQLDSLYQWFPKRQVLVVVSERIRENLATGYNAFFDFLGLSPVKANFLEHYVGREAPPMNAETRRLILRVYREPNEKLFSLLGMSIPEWTR